MYVKSVIAVPVLSLLGIRFVPLALANPLGVVFLISDSHGGLIQAIEKRFHGMSWQRYQVHLTRSLPTQPAQVSGGRMGNARTAIGKSACENNNGLFLQAKPSVIKATGKNLQQLLDLTLNFEEVINLSQPPAIRY